MQRVMPLVVTSKTLPAMREPTDVEWVTRYVRHAYADAGLFAASLGDVGPKPADPIVEFEAIVESRGRLLVSPNLRERLTRVELHHADGGAVTYWTRDGETEHLHPDTTPCQAHKSARRPLRRSRRPWEIPT